MSLKESIRRREIRNHGYRSAAIIDSKTQIEKEKTEKAIAGPTVEELQSAARSAILQRLDKADKSSVEKRIESTIKFAKETTDMFVLEYNALKVKNIKTLTRLISVYKTHISQLLKFDKEVDFNKTTYTKNLAEQFVEDIITLNDTFYDIFKPKTETISVK